MGNNYEAYYYAALIVQHLKGQLSEDEEIKLQQWLQASPENALLLKKLQNEDHVKTEIDFLSTINNQKAWQNIVLRANKTPLSHKIYLLIQKWKYAAIILLMLSVAVLFYKSSRNSLPQHQQAVIVNKYKNDIPPGTDKAQLILPDGSVLEMNGRTAGTVKRYSGLKIRSNSGQLSYQLTGANNTMQEQYNTVVTPAGCKYRVTLPDGSMVWLNSASSLKFPLIFNHAERKVYLTGEAYFEVAKNKHQPFKVYSNNAIVRVLGTHFNVSAYANEPAVKVTLLEGSVKITKGTQSKLIVPGEQASINTSETDRHAAAISVQTTDVNESVAWKNNQFLFDSEDVESVMKQIARWYNVDIEYLNGIPKIHFSGSISRNNNLSQILNMLELTGGVHFNIEGRRIIVTR